MYLESEKIEYSPEKMDCEECRRVLDSLYAAHAQIIMSVHNRTGMVLSMMGAFIAFFAVIVSLQVLGFKDGTLLYIEIIGLVVIGAYAIAEEKIFSSNRKKVANHVRSQIYKIRNHCRKKCKDAESQCEGGLPELK